MGKRQEPQGRTSGLKFASKSQEPIRLELKDLDLFCASDVPTRLANLQHYFFPKLERLVAESLSLVQDILGAQVSEGYALIHHPKFRRDASNPVETSQVWVGIGPQRDNEPRVVRKPDGTPYRMGPGYLLFHIRAAGGIQTIWQPYRWSDQPFRGKLAQLVIEHRIPLQFLLSRSNIAITCEPADVMGFDALLHDSALLLGPVYPLPLVTAHAQRRLMMEFALLFSLFHAATCLARGDDVELAEYLDVILEWYGGTDEWLAPALAQNHGELRDESLGYATIRPRRWWSVLARDKWTCCACGRRASKDGVTLEVDHITPRSKGGTDDEDNLQTLCRKCNSGKSNLDDTSLRADDIREIPPNPSTTGVSHT